MQDDSRVYLSDSLKDIIDLEDKSESKELNKNFNNKVIKNINQVFTEIKTIYSEKKIIGAFNKIKKSKNSTTYCFLINENSMKQLISSNIENILIYNDLDVVNIYSCEDYNIYYSIKKVSENIYILKTKIKEIKNE